MKSDTFSFGDLALTDQRLAIARLGPFPWLLKTNFVWQNTNSKREIVIVCEKGFDNVPKPTIWNLYRKNRAHAVGYSDGTTGLISPEQFTNLSLIGFVSLSQLATNAEFNSPIP